MESQPAQDMCDIVHFYFETDNIGEKDAQEAKLKMRRVLYTQLYDRSYEWGNESSSDPWAGTEVNPADPYSTGPAPKLTHKPYVPPTPVNANAAKPFGNVLDAPMG